MTIAFDHRPLRLREAALARVRSVRVAAIGSRAVVALIGALAITASAAGILAMRLQATRSELGADLLRLDRTAAASAPARTTLRRIGEIRALADEISEARRSGDRAADELARLGNAVPSHVWIARFRRDGSDVVVDGGAGSVEAVGRALMTLSDDRTRAQLVGLKDASRPDAPSDVRYSLRIDQR